MPSHHQAINKSDFYLTNGGLAFFAGATQLEWEGRRVVEQRSATEIRC